MTSRRNQSEARALLILGLVLSDFCGEEYAAELYKQALRHDHKLVAAHVRLGFSYVYAEDYGAMIAAFGEAIRLDPLAARAAAHGRPDEASQIIRILFPPELDPAAGNYESAMPTQFREAGELVTQAIGQMSAGRDEEAVCALEQSLRIDVTNCFAVALLSLAYLLLREGSGVSSIEADGSVLIAIDDFPAELIFKQ